MAISGKSFAFDSNPTYSLVVKQKQYLLPPFSCWACQRGLSCGADGLRATLQSFARKVLREVACVFFGSQPFCQSQNCSRNLVFVQRLLQSLPSSHMVQSSPHDEYHAILSPHGLLISLPGDLLQYQSVFTKGNLKRLRHETYTLAVQCVCWIVWRPLGLAQRCDLLICIQH